MERPAAAAAIALVVWTTYFPQAASSGAGNIVRPHSLAAGQTDSSPPSPRDLLRTLARFSDEEWAAADRGQAVARVLDTDSREIAVVGAIRITAPRERLIERYRDIVALERSSLVLRAATFSTPPKAADLLTAPFEEYNLDLRSCRPGDCRVRLSADDIARFHREVDWNSPDWQERSASVWRSVLAAHAVAYLAQGRRGLPDFMNKAEPVSVASELAGLLEDFQFLGAYSPEFHRYIQDFGPRLPDGAQQLVYWTKEDFGVRPILRLSHQVVYRVDAPVAAAIIATNQIYADHYLDASLGVTLAIDARAAGKDGFYMIAVNRARTRSLSGFLRRFVRRTVQSRSRDAMTKILTSSKAGLER
jgi:hypothetical protein